MNWNERWASTRQDPRFARGGDYDLSHTLERLREPSVLVPLLFVIFTLIYNTSTNLPALLGIGWNCLVALIPARLLFALDNWLSPALFPRPQMLSAGQSNSHAAKSEALMRILGIDAAAGGIMASVTQAAGRRLPGFGGGGLAAAKRPKMAQPAGLGNISNSCYQNSILQGLASLKPLPEYLSLPASAKRPGDAAGSASGPAGTLRDLIAQLNDSANNGRTLWTPSVLKNMSTWTQQDASEYYHKLLDEVDEEISKAARASQPKVSGLEKLEASAASGSDDGSAASLHSCDSGYQSLSWAPSKANGPSSGAAAAVRNPLLGLQAQRVACVACGWSEGLSMIPFNSLTLSLGMGNQNHDLYDRLDAYTSIESIPGVYCGKCTLLKAQRLLKTLIERSQASEAKGGETGVVPEAYARIAAIEEALEEEDFDDKTITERCKITQKVSSTKTKQVVIARAPQSLVIHMNRSVFDENTGEQFKNFSPVRFPVLLDLAPWCLGSAIGRPAAATTGAGAGAVADKTDSEPAADDCEQWLLDPTTSMVAGDGRPSRTTGPLYELRAVITHQGRHENGHYVCYRKHPRLNKGGQDGAKREASAPPNLSPDGEGIDEACMDKKAEQEKGATTTTATATNTEADAEGLGDDLENSEWWRLSDQNVFRVTEDMVLDQGGVFMLFYDCVDPVPVLTSEAESEARRLESDDK